MVNVKNQEPAGKVSSRTTKEWIGTTERVGDTATFKLTSQVSLTVGYLNLRYRFIHGDTMSKGTDLQEVTSRNHR